MYIDYNTKLDRMRQEQRHNGMAFLVLSIALTSMGLVFLLGGSTAELISVYVVAGPLAVLLLWLFSSVSTGESAGRS